MKPPRLPALGAALGVFVTIGFTLQLLGGPFRRRPPQAPPAAPPCRPQTHVVFLKTHKTGGSSVVNVLHRFGHERGLRFALPHRYQFGYPQPFSARRVRGYRPGGPPFDIICHHMRFNLTEVQKVMPNDSFYFSIVRDPATLGESSFSYFRAAAPAFRSSPSLDAFLARPGRFYRRGERGNHYARNLQWFDFGLPEEPRGPGEVRAALAGLDRTFPLVLLAEHFDESLVLLRHALCWPEDAVDAFAHNARAGGSRGASSSSSSSSPPPGRAERLRAWNGLDWELYRHLNRSFWRRAEAFGTARLAREVSRLRRRRRSLAGTCLAGGGPVPAGAIPDGRLRPFQPPGGDTVLGFALRAGLRPELRERCLRMALPELPYKDLLERRQFGGSNGSRGAGMGPGDPG